jgi:hypothetical protein
LQGCQSSGFPLALVHDGRTRFALPGRFRAPRCPWSAWRAGDGESAKLVTAGWLAWRWRFTAWIWRLVLVVLGPRRKRTRSYRARKRCVDWRGWRWRTQRWLPLARNHANYTIFGDVNLANVIGLETCKHWGPSIIDHQTLQKSGRLRATGLSWLGASACSLAHSAHGAKTRAAEAMRMARSKRGMTCRPRSRNGKARVEAKPRISAGVASFWGEGHSGGRGK